MDLKLKGKNVLVMGASKGIGRGIAEAFAEEGAKLTIVARSSDLLEDVKNACLSKGALDVKCYACDVTNEDMQKFGNEVMKERGVFDIVIHSIGTSLTSRNIFGGEKDWYEALRLDALHAIDMNSVLIPAMIDNKIKGKVIHVSSISAEMLRGNPLYASAKAYLNAYVTTAGRQLASQGIALNSVMPGAVAFEDSYWDKKEKNGDPAVEEFLRQHQAIHRFGRPEEVADLVLFLASDKASFIVASNVPVDGGNM